MNEQWTSFAETIVVVIRNFIQVSKAKNDVGKSNPAMTQQCKDAISVKHRKWKKYKYCKNEENFNAYKQARNHVVSELRKSNNSYEKDPATRIKTDSKHFWSHVQAKTKPNSTIYALKSGDDTTTSCDQERANILNTY